MNKCFSSMLLFCVAACFGDAQGGIVAQLPSLTQPTLHTCAREGLFCVDTCLGAAKGMATVPPGYVEQALTDTVPATPTATKNYHYKTFTSADGTYGYDIFTGPKKLIHQATIPGQPGNKGFTRENSAAKVATLVMNKLQQNIFPPTVSTAELKQLGVW